jgi:hypothetical protein
MPMSERTMRGKSRGGSLGRPFSFPRLALSSSLGCPDSQNLGANSIYMWLIGSPWASRRHSFWC